MLKSINKHIAVLLTTQMFFSPLVFAAEEATETFAVKASKALERNDFTDLENGSATFSYSDNSKAYVKVSDLTVDTTASDSSTNTVKLGKQYEVCSVSSDSRSVSCNYTTVKNDGSKTTKSLELDNTQEHQIYSIPANATFTDSDKKYFVTSYDNPFYKFRAVDSNGHISGTNCIKLNNSNSMVCSADENIDMSKLSASDFAQVDDTNKYQVNQDKLTNATFATSDGKCSIDGWVQADATHCCPPNTSEYSYNWDTAQQQCKVTKHNASKSKDNSKLKDLLSAATIFAGTMQQNKNKQQNTPQERESTTDLGENIVLQDSNIDKNAHVSIKFNPKVPVVSEDLNATITVKDTESDKLIVRIQAPTGKIDTSTAKSGKEFLLLSADAVEPGTYKLVIYVMNDAQRKATFSASFEVYDATLVLTDEQKKQYTDLKLTQITDDVEQFSILGDISNVQYDEENQICSFDLIDGYAQTGDTKAFKIEESMPAEVNTDRDSCDKIKNSNKLYIENGLLHREGNRFGVIINDDSFLLADNQSYLVNEFTQSEIESTIDAISKEIGDISTISIADSSKVVSVSFDENSEALLTDTASGDVYTLSDFEEAYGLEEGSLVVKTRTLEDGTTISRAYIDDGTVSNVFIRDSFDKLAKDMSDTPKKVSRISDFTVNNLNTVDYKKKQKENKVFKSVAGCLDDAMKDVLKTLNLPKIVPDTPGNTIAELIQRMLQN